MDRLAVPVAMVERTLALLREGGAEGRETVVFWLGSGAAAREVYRPEQIADRDFFRLDGQSMRSLMRRLRESRLGIVAQVHSHPGRAFHSEADDQWAVVRHEGALSLVLPRFALGTTAESFIADAATFQLRADDQWIAVATHERVLVIDRPV